VPVDDHEFGAFFVSHYGRLYALGVLLTGDRGQAEELAQDTLVRIYRRWALVGPPDDPASFARRVLINRHRSLLRRGVVEARQLLRLGADAQPVVDQPEDAMVMWAAVRQLPSRQRAVIVLRYYEDLSEVEADARPPAVLVGRPADAARPGPADQPHADRQPAKLPRVLLVDDSTSMRRVLRGLLEDAGIEVVGEATDGAEGVELAVALRPDVVLMDWRMPRLDGVQATARIRQRLPEVQVVMFSSLEGAGIGVAAREAGASAFVGKGASPDQLCAAVLAAAPPGS
jgi:RNA polymerase sigma factor (sigma-70 family)